MWNLSRPAALASSVLSALLLASLGACGGEDQVSAEHNAADVTFTTGMLPHHQQAVEMADLAASHDAGREVRDLAKRIKAAQGPEITQLNGFLDAWGEDSQPMGASDMDTMSPQDMRELSTAQGAAFDDLFLTQMIQHHEGAVAMARSEQSQGSSQDAIDLATGIRESQTSEIREMRTLLAGG